MLMRTPVRISYGIVVLLLALAVWLHLGTLLLTTLFGYLALQCFCIRGHKAVSIAIYCVVVAVLVVGFFGFSGVAYHALPKIAETSIPAVAEFAEKNGVELPFTDFDSLKSAALAQAQAGAAIIGAFAKVASLQFVMLAAGLVIAASMFLTPYPTARECKPAPGDLYTAVLCELAARFKNLYQSFAKVMGAQIIISAINTALTAAFLLLNGYPYAVLLLITVFLCGLLPVVGNLISNTIIVCVGFSLSPRAGIIALIFLVAIHKLEYFLNSKIVGRRIGSPMWLTLIGLIVGERLMGLAGMALAPALLHYIKAEASAWRAESETKHEE